MANKNPNTENREKAPKRRNPFVRTMITIGRTIAVILVTAASGGWQAATLLRQCVPSMTPETVLILAAAFIVAGAVFQFMTTRKLAKK